MSAPTTAAAPRGVDRALAARRQKYAAEHDRLVAAALDLMRTSGTIEPTVADVLGASGLSTAAFYRLFPSKDDLLLAVLERVGANARAHLARRTRGPLDPVARIGTWVEGVLAMGGRPATLRANRAFLLAHPRLVERFPAEMTAMVDLLVEPLALAIADARGAGHDPVALDGARRDARLVHHLTHGLLVDRAAEGRVVSPDDVAAVVGHVVRATVGTVPPGSAGGRP